MPIWNRLRTELDRAGRVAQQAFDEGRLRLEMLRAQRDADAGAQKLGYALHRARREQRELTAEEYAGLARVIENAELEVERHRRLIDEAIARRRGALVASEPAAPNVDAPRDPTSGSAAR